MDSTNFPSLHDMILALRPRPRTNITVAIPHFFYPWRCWFRLICMVIWLGGKTPFVTSTKLLYDELPHSVNLVHHLSPPSQLTPSITSSLFHSRLKTHLFHKSFLPQTSPTHRTAHWTSYHFALCLFLPLSSFSWPVCRTKLAFS